MTTHVEERMSKIPGTANHPEHFKSIIKKIVTIRRTPEEVYHFCKDFENLAAALNVQVQPQSKQDGRWIWSQQTGEKKAEWNIEIANDRPNEVIAWRSLDKDEDYAGSLQFHPAPGGRGTELLATFAFNPQGSFALLFKGKEDKPETQLDQMVRAIKQYLEVGEILLNPSEAL